ncbi:MAG: DMT family transporter [Anaerovoracaceae bacterium]
MSDSRKEVGFWIYLIPVLSGVFFGMVGIFVRGLAAAGMDSMTILFARVAPAVVVLLLFLLLYDRTLLRLRLRDLWIYAVCGLVGMLMTNYCYAEAVQEVTLSLVAILIRFSSVFVILFSLPFFHEAITRRKVFCIVLALVGAVMVSGVLDQGVGSVTLRGILLGLGAALAYALYSVFSKVAMQRGSDGFTILFYSLLFMTAALVPLTKYRVIGTYLSAAPAPHISFLLAQSVFCVVLAYICYLIPIRYIEVGRVSILEGSEPVAAALFGFWFFREVPTPLTIAGIAVTIGALTILCLPERRPRRPRLRHRR